MQAIAGFISREIVEKVGRGAGAQSIGQSESNSRLLHLPRSAILLFSPRDCAAA
jgi:hypothetical protein